MSDVKKTVLKLMKKYQTNDPFKIANYKNIILMYEKLGNTYGYYNCYKRIKIIHINEKLDELTQRFVCAHELGHAILHPDSNTPFLRKNTFFSIDKIEVENTKPNPKVVLKPKKKLRSLLP